MTETPEERRKYALGALKHEVEDKAVEYLNAARLEYLEEKALDQLNRSAGNGYVRLHKLEFSALLNAVRGLQRKRRDLEEACRLALKDLETEMVYGPVRDALIAALPKAEGTTP